MLRTPRARLTGLALACGALVLTLLPAQSEAGGSHADPNVVNTGSRAAVRQAYLDRWLPTELNLMVTTGGSVGACRPFRSAATSQRATAAAINFARGLVGESAIRLVPRYDDLAARSALIMSANKALSHDPPHAWKCWSRTGHDAAGKSNIAITSMLPSAADLARLYLDDDGSGNTAVGHRRWVLRPEATTMGSGNAAGSWFGNDLYVFTFGDDNAKAPAQTYYAWPGAGWFPAPLEPGGRWSLSSSTGASFAGARVTVTGPNGSSLPLTRRPVATGYADNTLVWDLRTPPAAVHGVAAPAYRVTVSGIKGAPTTSYSYTVRLFDPTLPG
ncbi:MAG: hypothetical protein ACR2FG_07895 [Marmoricola sp.]